MQEIGTTKGGKPIKGILNQQKNPEGQRDQGTLQSESFILSQER